MSHCGITSPRAVLGPAVDAGRAGTCHPGRQKPPAGFADFRQGFFTPCNVQRLSGPQPHQTAKNSRGRRKHRPHRQTPPPERTARETEQTGQATSQRHRQTGRPTTKHDRTQTHDKRQHTTRQAPPKPQNEKRAGDPPEGGTPATVSHAGRGHGRQGPRLWAACRPARGLPWPCRPGQRPAIPPAGGVPLRPAAREARGRRRLSPPVRAAVLIADPRRGANRTSGVCAAQ